MILLRQSPKYRRPFVGRGRTFRVSNPPARTEDSFCSVLSVQSCSVESVSRLTGIQKSAIDPNGRDYGPTEDSPCNISGAFDEMVKENIDDLGMDPAEALEHAIHTQLQGVYLSGIVQCVPGQISVGDHPVIQTLTSLKLLRSDIEPLTSPEIVELLERLSELCYSKGSGNAAIATKNGGLELLISILSNLPWNWPHRALDLALNTLVSLLYDLQSTETFRENGGPKIVMGILNYHSLDDSILNSGFSVVAAAASGNEVLKESFMDLKIDELIIKILREHIGRSLPGLYDAMRVLLTSDDNRVVVSQVYGYARTFAKLGIVETLVNTLRESLSSPCLVSASITLKYVAVNEEICRLVADSGGIDAILCCLDDSGEPGNRAVARACYSLFIDDSGEQGNRSVARACCSLLSKLAGSDVNKGVIIEKRGMHRLIKLASRFSEDRTVLHEVMSLISVLCLGSPDNAAHAMEAGAGDLAMQVMQRFPESYQLQRNACLMIRNLVVRNAENRTILLGHGIEKSIRKAKSSHNICKDAATDALRDLGLENYNS